ncbi:hypothetical protein ABAZ39_11540 [Azospirillum argentinense]|uniref:Integrase n=1 Tax=Azospirillum argentinense TaxID=2970906 RepID=A0A060DNY4_9PROT|nr:hypothetical protein ABAZ39_11540 [Azospirillum argentinense]EZQ09857.1 hypothetical protein ABAZ39_12970 [Azospirillum argentinense]
MAQALVTLQQRDHGDLVWHEALDFPFFKRGRKRDLTFSWVLQIDPRMEQWRSFAEEYLAGRSGYLDQVLTFVGQFLAHVAKNPALPREPKVFLEKRRPSDTPLTPAFDPESSFCANHVFHFLDWVLATKFTTEDDEGNPVRMPGLYNPVQRRQRGYIPDETVREAMPTRYIRMTLEILSENDWAWAKKLFNGPKGGDWITWRNPETGQQEEVWCPARAVALFVKLRMPFRTVQVRTTDDGSADTYIYDRANRSMVLNHGPLQQGNPANPVQRGVIQATADNKGGRTILTARLTTNKTADIDKEAWQKGYTCPWLPDDVAEVLMYLADWQKIYNPVSAPTPWGKLLEMRGRVAKRTLEGMENCFLFRDATNKVGRRDEPIFNHKINILWLKLMDELERRLAASGITGPDDQPIILIGTRNPNGSPSSAVYDLHSLRVSIVTNLIETGKVAPEVMMKVVGHAVVTMTLYYTKHSTVFIADQLSEADAALLQQEQDNWLRHQRSQAFKDLTRAVAHQSEAGLLAFSNASPGSLVPVPIGICPVGGAMCHKGGAKLSGKKGADDYGPVVGGRSNCAGCRFSISGEPFLHGIQAEFNARSFEATGLNRTREQIGASYERLDAERRTADATGTPFLDHREWFRLADRLEEIDARAAQLAVEMANLWTLQEQVTSLAFRRQTEEAAGVALVVGDVPSVTAALEESTEWELADRLCRASVVYPSLAARGNLPQYANEFRLKRFDRMLSRNGLQPRFLDMDEGLSLYVGNRLTDFLMLRIGREGTLRLMDGESSLAEESVRAGLLPEQFCDDLMNAFAEQEPQQIILAREHALAGGPKCVAME